MAVMLEPVNRYELNFINSLDEASGLIEMLGTGSLWLMPDVFHMNIEEALIEESLTRNASLIRYLHLADSNRLAPGRGHVDFHSVFSALLQAGYGGWAAVEILPQPDPDTAARQAAEFLLPRIAEYNWKLSHAASHR